MDLLEGTGRSVVNHTSVDIYSCNVRVELDRTVRLVEREIELRGDADPLASGAD